MGPHNPNSGMRVGAKQEMSDFVRDDMAEYRRQSLPSGYEGGQRVLTEPLDWVVEDIAVTPRSLFGQIGNTKSEYRQIA